MPSPLTARLLSRSLIAPGIADLVFQMGEPARLQFRGGQFVSLAIGKDAGGQPVRRSYSIASSSRDGDRLRFLVRVMPEGTASDFLMNLDVGTDVQMTGPHGFFVLDPEHTGDIVFGATGTGVAAIMPMLTELAEREPAERRLLYWGSRHEGDLFAREEIETLCAEAGTELFVHLTSPPPGWKGGRGRITQPLLEGLSDLRQPTFYLVGNGAMITEVKKELVARGVDRKKQIRTEAFFD
jgi:ferredoxin-NADP reductase